MLKKDHPIIYIFYAIIGALILTSCYHFSINDKHKLCALLPALPIIGLFSLFLIYFNSKSNLLTKNYIIHHIHFLLYTVLIYIITYITYLYTNNIFVSLIIALSVWSTIIYYYF